MGVNLPPTKLGPVRVVPGLLWGFLGDSITNGSAASNFAYSFAPAAIAMAGGMVARADSIEAGTPGDKSADMLARIGALFAYNIDGLVIVAGTNDAGNSVPLSTYSANMTAIIVAAKQRGMAVVVCTVPPAGSGQAASRHQLVTAYNAWIRLVAPQYGCEVADVFAVLANASSGALQAGYDSGDGVHPNDFGHQTMARPVAKAMLAAARRTVPWQGLVTGGGSSGTSNLIADPLNARATPTTAPWSEFAGGTGTAPAYAMKADGTGGALPYGQWAEMDFDGTASGGTRRLNVSTTDFAVGDLLLMCFNIQVEDVSGTWVTDCANGIASVKPQLVNQGAVAIPNATPLQRCAGIPQAANPTVYDIGPTVWPVVVPAGTTQIILWLSTTVPTGKHLKARWGCVGLLHATRIGIDSYLGGWGSAMVNT